ncbi:PAS domain S-box protein [Marinifilum flexuosum]|uniref:sensor histidine kinase n=1 Tax=Marinifilum flexuosum TaxID=1117708 RepID=UPI002495921A|nr:PAS domain S-box protein [Marinifilum flexuosum]
MLIRSPLLSRILHWINSLPIKSKLILLLTAINLFAILAITFITLNGADSLKNSLLSNLENTFQQNKRSYQELSHKAIQNHINELDLEYQKYIEHYGNNIANEIAQFLYQRDDDLLLLAKLPLSNKNFENFLNQRTSHIRIQGEYFYDEIFHNWKIKSTPPQKSDTIPIPLEQNEHFFNYNPPYSINTREIPIYREISFFDLSGQEKIKFGDISNSLNNIRYKKNTYIQSENYFSEIQNLKKGEIYISQLIGAYVGSRIRGIYNKENAKKAGEDFNPEESAFAGIENPKGKRFEGIIRLVTPYFQNNIKIGYISIALNHQHIQEFTDYTSPIMGEKRDIPNSETANYCYIWSNDGLIVSHPKNYYIMGYDPQTGKRVAPWMDHELFEKWKASKITDAYTFLKRIPKWQNPEQLKNPSKKQQLDSAQMGLDMRYSNEPMWTGYGLFQITKNGGSGSYQYYWDKKWKLTAVSPIPYYTGRYAKSKRGFGIVCLGADVKEFHKAAIATEQKTSEIIAKGNESMNQSLDQSRNYILNFAVSTKKNFGLIAAIVFILVILVSIGISVYLSSKLENLIIGTKEFGKENFNYRIPHKSRDEIGILEAAFNLMADKLQAIYNKQKQTQKNLIEQNAKLEYTSYFLNQLKEHSPDAILVHCPNGEIQSINKTCEDLLGYSREEILEVNIQTLSTPPYSQEEALEKIKTALNRGGNEFEWCLQSKSGKKIPSIVRMRKIVVENEDYVLSFITDIRKRKKAETELAKAHRQLTDIIEFLPDATFVIDKEKKVIAWNRALEDMTFISKSDMLGKGNYEYSIPFYGTRRPILIDLIGNDDSALKDKYNNVSEKGQYIMGEVYVPSLYGGKGATVRVTASPLINEKGKMYGAIESVRDISHLKEAEENLKKSEEKFRTIFDQGVLGIFQTTLDGKFININRALAKMIGYDHPEEVLSSANKKTHEIYLYPERRKLIIDKLMKVGKLTTYSEKLRRNTGEIWTGNINARLVRDSFQNPLYIEGFIEDVTALKEYEEQLIKAKHKAEESDRLKSAFLANMSHEIRTPLNGILGFSSLLTSDNLKPEKKDKFINIINQNSNQLVRIINDILDFSKIEIGQLVINKTKFNVADLLNEIYTASLEQLNEKTKSHLQLILDLKPELSEIQINSDRVRIKQILSNIVENAIKFTLEGSISFGFDIKENIGIQFFVQDTGIGIPPDMSKEIFGRFRQIEEDHTRNYGGTGLGLSISKELSKLLGGKIWFESIRNEGTIFYVLIPNQIK